VPFPSEGSDIEQLVRRLTAEPPSVRALLPELPEELDRVMQKMMALNPDARYGSPQEVMQALLPFLRPPTSISIGMYPEAPAYPHPNGHIVASEGGRQHRVLVIDDEPGIRMFCRELLLMDNIAVVEAETGAVGLRAASEHKPDLVLLDVCLPDCGGRELL